MMQRDALVNRSAPRGLCFKKLLGVSLKDNFASKGSGARPELYHPI